MKKIVYVLFALGVIWACSDDATPTGPIDDDVPGGGIDAAFSRAELLENWADNIIIPSYQGFISDFEGLETALQAFSTDRTEVNLQALRAAWEVAYRSWQHISLFENGPGETANLRLNVNTFPADTGLITSQIASGEYNFNLSSTRDTKGFPAIDYLLNGLGASDAEIVAFFTDADTGENHITYLEDVVNDIGTRVAAVLQEWTSGFRDTFVANAGSSSSASVDRMTNDFIFYYERFLRAGKMGIPAGVFSNGQVAPNTIEAFYSEGLSNDLFLEGLDAVQDFFNGVSFTSGANGVGYDDYLQSIEASNGLDGDINDQFNAARIAVSGLNSFLSEIEDNNPPIAMLQAYDEVQRNVAFIKTDMFSLLSIDVDFVDADGD